MAYRSNSKALARKHLDRRLSPLRANQDLVRPPRGWLKAIREALGMTTAQLAARIGVSQPRVPQLERSEAEGTVTLKTLRQAAEALDCTLIYALVPNHSLDETVRRQAEKLAELQLARTNQSMKLENQALTSRELAAERARLVQALLIESPRHLWDVS
jgi:predicted DNA-binding mobile mystery protein A